MSPEDRLLTDITIMVDSIEPMDPVESGHIADASAWLCLTNDVFRRTTAPTEPANCDHDPARPPGPAHRRQPLVRPRPRPPGAVGAGREGVRQRALVETPSEIRAADPGLFDPHMDRMLDKLKTLVA